MRIGFIGAGGIASRHIGNLLAMDDLQVVAAADPLLERAQQAAARFGGKAYDSAERMLDAEALDAVFICVPPFAHGPVETAVVERDLPFFVEKPLATDDATAAEIAAEVERRRLITAVGYHWRYLDIVEQAQELLISRPPRLVQGYWLDQTPPPAWWRVQKRSGGQFVEQTTHIFDLARLLAGEVTTVSAIGGRASRADFPDADICDAAVASLRFASGAVGAISSTCLLRWSHRIGLHLFSDALALEIAEREMIVDIGQGRPVTPSRNDPFVAEARDFIDAVAGARNKIRAPYREALRTHRLATSAARSIDQGCAIQLAQEEPLHV